MEIRYKINSKILILAMFGAILASSSYLILAYNPLEMIIDKLTQLTPGSLFLSIWRIPPYEVLIDVYIFNVTNPKEFLAGKEKLNLTQVGPYVYQEMLSNTNITFNDNGTMTFYPRRALKFRPELSIGDPNVNRLISPNIPLLGITSSLNDASMITNLAVSSITNFLGTKQFLNLTINDYLWGYDDRLVTLANRAIPSWIDFQRFGIFDRLMALDNASNVVTLNLKPELGYASHLLDEQVRMTKYHIHRWNGSPGLKHWGYIEPKGNETVTTNRRCHLVEGTMDGSVYPTYLKKNTTLRLYRRAFCRPVPFVYDHDLYTDDGLYGYLYRIDDLFLANPNENPDNICYCVKEKCLLKGLGSLSPCYYGIPIAISQPHFLNADPQLLKQVNGMVPNDTQHGSTVIINPYLGVPLKASLRIQINLDVGQTKYNSRTRPFNNLTLPLFWLGLRVEQVPKDLYIYIKLLYHILPIIQQVCIYLFAIIGVLLVSGSAVLILFYSRPEQNHRLSFKSEYSPLPLVQTHYFKPNVRICK